MRDISNIGKQTVAHGNIQVAMFDGARIFGKRID
jgi:hypothetical protein